MDLTRSICFFTFGVQTGYHRPRSHLPHQEHVNRKNPCISPEEQLQHQCWLLLCLPRPQTTDPHGTDTDRLRLRPHPNQRSLSQGSGYPHTAFGDPSEGPSHQSRLLPSILYYFFGLRVSGNHSEQLWSFWVQARNSISAWSPSYSMTCLRAAVTS